MCYFVVLWIQAVSSQFGVVSKFALILLTILCTAVSNYSHYISPGRPRSTISWTAPTKDVYRLNPATNYYGIEVDIDGTLLITNLTDGDNGTYTCTATNLKGWYNFLISNASILEEYYRLLLHKEKMGSWNIAGTEIPRFY